MNFHIKAKVVARSTESTVGDGSGCDMTLLYYLMTVMVENVNISLEK